MYFIYSGSYNLPASYFKGFIELWKEESDGEIAFRSDCSNISHILYMVQLSAFVFFSCLLWEEDSPVMAEQDTDL